LEQREKEIIIEEREDPVPLARFSPRGKKYKVLYHIVDQIKYKLLLLYQFSGSVLQSYTPTLSKVNPSPTLFLKLHTEILIVILNVNSY
jgi:hypothetical protein